MNESEPLQEICMYVFSTVCSVIFEIRKFWMIFIFHEFGMFVDSVRFIELFFFFLVLLEVLLSHFSGITNTWIESVFLCVLTESYFIVIEILLKFLINYFYTAVNVHNEEIQHRFKRKYKNRFYCSVLIIKKLQYKIFSTLICCMMYTKTVVQSVSSGTN